MCLPVDTNVVSFVSARPAEPNIDFDTKGVAVNGIGHVWPSPAIESQPRTVTEVRGCRGDRRIAR
jgi:hypothetical protein